MAPYLSLSSNLLILSDMAIGKHTWFGRFGSWLRDNFHKETRRDDGLGRFLDGIDNAWNAITGSGLTTAQQQANQNEINKAELGFAREEEFYEKYNSIQAQIQQGVNPFGINGSVQSGPSFTSAGSSTPSASGELGIIPLLSQIIGASFKAKELDISRSRAAAQNDLDSAQAGYLRKQAGRYDELTDATIGKMRSDIRMNSQKINESMQSVAESAQRIRESVSRIGKAAQDIKESDKRIAFMDKEMEQIDTNIKVGESTIKLNGSQAALNATASILNKLKADEISAMLPYVQARQEAAIALQNAQSRHEHAAALKALEDANLAFLGGLKEQKLIDDGYYDELVKQNQHATTQASWDAKMAKRKYKWSPVNDVCSNVSKVALAAGSLMSGAGAVMGAGASVMNAGLNAAGASAWIDRAPVGF